MSMNNDNDLVTLTPIVIEPVDGAEISQVVKLEQEEWLNYRVSKQENDAHSSYSSSQKCVDKWGSSTLIHDGSHISSTQFTLSRDEAGFFTRKGANPIVTYDPSKIYQHGIMKEYDTYSSDISEECNKWNWSTAMLKDADISQKQLAPTTDEIGLVAPKGSNPILTYDPSKIYQHEIIREGDNPGCASNSSKSPLRHQCVSCRDYFQTKMELKTHTVNTHSRTAFKCATCSKSFKTPDTLASHTKRHKLLECPVCCKIFLKWRALKKHMRTHSEEDNHMMIHTGEKRFECSICHIKFAHRSTLKSHVMIHTGEKPYDCSICHKKFRHRSTLHYHKKSHMDKKLFECSIFEKKYMHNKSLNYHMKIHRTDKKSI